MFAFLLAGDLVFSLILVHVPLVGSPAPTKPFLYLFKSVWLGGRLSATPVWVGVQQINLLNVL
jgi:hypothetical protein